MSNQQPSNKKAMIAEQDQNKHTYSMIPQSYQDSPLFIPPNQPQPKQQQQKPNQSFQHNSFEQTKLYEDSMQGLMADNNNQQCDTTTIQNILPKVHSQQIGDNIDWIQFVNSIQTYQKPPQFLHILYNKIKSLGRFCSQISTLITNSFSKPISKKLIKSYQKIMLDSLIQPIFKIVQDLSLDDLKDEQKRALFKSIGQGDEQGIIVVLQTLLDTEDIKFPQVVQQLLKLYQKPQQILQQMKNQSQQSVLKQQLTQQKVNTNNDDGAQMMAALVNKQTQTFTSYLQQNKANIQKEAIDKIIQLKFSQGRFSLQIDEYIKNHNDIKKHIKKKVQECFDDLFRDFQLSQQMMVKFQQLQFDGKDVKQIKSYIRRDQYKKIEQKLNEFMQDQDQAYEYAKKLISQAPVQIAQHNKSNDNSMITKLSKQLQSSNSITQSVNNNSPKKQQFSSKKQIKDNKYNQQQQQKDQKQVMNQSKQQGQSFQTGRFNNSQSLNHSIVDQSLSSSQQANDTFNQSSSYQQSNNTLNQSLQQQQNCKTYDHNNKQYIQLGGNNNNKKQKFKEKQITQFYQNNNQSSDPTLKLKKTQQKQQPISSKRAKAFTKSKNQQDFPTPQSAHGSKNNHGFPQFQQHNDHFQQNQYHQKLPFHQQPEDQIYYNKNQNQSPQQFNYSFSNEHQHKITHYPKESNNLVRYLMVVKQKKTHFVIHVNNKQQPIKLSQAFVDRWQKGKVQAFIYRLSIDPSVKEYVILPQKQHFWNRSQQFQVTRKQLENKQLTARYLIDFNLDQSYPQFISFYAMNVLNQYSKKRQFREFWDTLKNLNYIFKQNRQSMQFCLGWIPKLYHMKKYRFTNQCSRLLLYFIFQYVDKTLNPLDFQNHYIHYISYVTEIEENMKTVPYFNHRYTPLVQTKLILNCTIHRYRKDLYADQNYFQHNFNTVFNSLTDFDSKLKFIKSLKNVLQQKVALIYPFIKDYISFANNSVFQFIALKITLINIQKANNQNYDPYQQNKRVWLLHIIRQVKSYIFHLSKHDQQIQRQDLKRMSRYQNDIEEILLGKNRSNQYFLYNHETFYDFYSELILLKEQIDFDLYKYFIKSLAENRKNRAIEHVILRTQKSAQMIAFICSQGQEQRKELFQIIRKFTTENFNILPVITSWYGQHFKKQNNNFFIKVFESMMENVRNREFSVYQFLRTIEPYHQSKVKIEEVILFERSVVQKMKRFCQLPELQTHLQQIKEIKRNVRVPYLEELSIRLEQLKPQLKKLEEVTSVIVSDFAIDKSDCDIILKKLFQNRNDKDKNTLKQEIIQYYSEGKKELRALGYYPIFSKVLKDIVKQVEQKEISYSIIQQMKKVKIKVSVEHCKQDFIRLGKLVQDFFRDIEMLRRKNANLIKVLKQYDNLFKEYIDQLSEWNKELPNSSIKDSLRNIKKYKDYLDNSVQINSLMKIPLWKKDQIRLLPDLLVMRENTIKRYGELIDQFQNQTLSFVEFKKYFKIDLLSTLLENINDRNEGFINKLTDYISYLDEKTLKNYQTAILAVNQISHDIQNKQHFQSKLLDVIATLQNPDQQLTIQLAFKFIKGVDKKFKELHFDILDENQEILKTIIFKKKYKRVFDMIKEKKIDPQTVLNDLKEYINDVQNSILKIQDIKELENVVLFHEMHKNAKNFRTFLEDLRKQVKSKKLQLSENIFNVDSKLKQIDQMIDSSANRQTSFKYDLQQIFKSSVVRINNYNGFAHVEIEIQKTSEKQLMGNESSPQKNKKQTQIFTFKKLSQYKDKAILLVNDFQKSSQNQEIMQQTIDLLKQFLGLYKILQEIETNLNKAVIYGYNPQDLSQAKKIKENNYQEIQKMKCSIEKIANEWIEGMKEIYEKSYLLTHFMGPNLNTFINDTLNFKFSPLIKQIIDLDENEFAKQLDSLRYIGLNHQKSTQINKVKQICRIFHKIEQKTLQRFQRRGMIETQSIKSHIELITCNSVQNYYYALVKGNAKPQMNEILYLQKQTTFEEIQVFIKRAIIKHQRTHYFIGVHYLPAQVQLKFIDLLNEYVRTEEKRNKFNKCKFCFIDESPIQKVYLHLSKKQLFNAKPITDTHLKTLQETKYLLANIGETYLVESKIAGLGKTYWAEKKKPNSNIVYFSIGGHVHFSRLLERLKSKNFVENKPNTLIVQIGHVENKNKLEIFLFQLIFFKGFNFKQFFFLPRDTTLIIEMENTYQTINKYDYYSILKIIKQKKQKYVWIEEFKLQQLEPNFRNIQQAFTFTYLLNINLKNLLKKQISFVDFEKDWKNFNIKVCSPQDARKLIKFYFIQQLKRSNTEPTFWLYHSFIKLLFVAFKTFSQNGCFNILALESNCRANRSLGLDNVRLDFLNCCIKNCIQFLEATINTNQFKENEFQEKNMGQEKDFRASLAKFPFLIMPAYDFQNYQFVYLNSEQVNVSIKSLIISQTIFKYIKYNKHGYQQSVLKRRLDPKIVSDLFSEDSLQHLREEKLQKEIYDILYILSGNQLFHIKGNKTIKEFKNENEKIKNYSITLDNFFKMCLIIQRAVAHIPIIIMGESGVGKTALIKFLVEVVFRQRFLVFNIHAGIDEPKLVEYYQEIIKISEELKPFPNQKVWVFFDQFNTSDQLSYIKEMIIDRKFQGQRIPENVVLIGACNPYRKKKESTYKHAGIKKKVLEQKNQNSSELAFKVKPPPLSMIQFMWDYQQLQFKQNLNYISKILQSLQLSTHQIVVQAIADLHELFKKTYEISSVSLRDVTRFKELYQWFLTYMPRTQDTQQNSKRNPNYDLNEETRAIALSISFCYSLRIADRTQRKELLKRMTSLLKFDIPIEKIVQNEQTDYVERLKLSTERIAINFSLRENVFTTLVCIMNKIPVLIIGNPGNSKSLSIRMISSNLRGLNSESQFCQKFPELSIIYFQGSQACTSKGVQAVFQKAIKSNEDFKKKKQKQTGLGDVENCVLFDQIGLAQKSVHNPLKVLHSKLETDQKQICFIGISNWELDAAKMSRFLVLSRSNPEKEQLQDTAVKILESYLKRESPKYEKTFKEMSDWYYDFVDHWDKENQSNEKEGFFGLRDFYCYIKDVAAELENYQNSKIGSAVNIDDIIRKAIKSNFDGQQESVEIFLKISGLTEIQKQHIIDPIKLVEENLQKESSRCLLLIVKGDALLPIIHSKLKKNGQKRRIDCIYGSTFASDQQSEEYNLQITSIIISHMSRGTLLTFKNPNNSIQTSLYDVFNKSFTFSGPKKYCRVAVGANSNPKCVVHESFGSVVFIDEDIIKNTDLAFLNRFEKHFLTLSNVISNFEKQFVHEITAWINNLLIFKNKTQFKKQEQYLINSSEESVVTLVLKYRDLFDTNKQLGIKKIKKALLKNATEHFFIVLKDEKKHLIPAGIKSEVNKLFEEMQNQKRKKSIPMEENFSFQDIVEEEIISKNKIIFTYDQNIYSSPTYMFCNERTLKIRISEIKSERQLRKSLKDAFASQKIGNIHILIDFQKEFYHLNFVAFLITGLKQEVKSNKTIFIIIKLSQSSLQNAGRDHINISYLLDFEQMYIGSLTKGMNFMEMIEQKTVKELYVERKMDDNFDNYYHEAMMRFKLYKNQKDTLKKVPTEAIQQFQFEQIMKMNQNEMFRTEVKNFIYDNLSEDKIDISVILNNKQDRNLCSSPQESFDKYLQNCVIQTICTFFDRAYRNGLLFAFDLPALLMFLNNYYDVKLLQTIYEMTEDNYRLFLSQLVNIFIKDKSLSQKSYLKVYNSNALQIKPMCLLPMGLPELSYISNSEEDSLFKNSSKILQLLKNSDTEAIQNCQISIEKCLSILNEKSVFLKTKKGPFDFEKFLNKNSHLQIFYFFDLISKIYSQTIEDNQQIETKAFPLAKIVYLFASIFKKLEVKQKILLLSLSKELWSSIFNLWILWITNNQSTDFHRKIEDHYLRNRVISNQDNEPHKLPQLLKELCQSTMSLQQQLLNIENMLSYGMHKYLSFFRSTYFYTQRIRLICMDLDVETSSNQKATKRFFDLMDEIYDRDEIDEQMAIFLTSQQSSFESRVEKYLSGVLLDQERNYAQIQHILSYLSLDVYGMWIERLNENKQNQNLDLEIQSCIESFIRYSNQYASFANNSSFFLQNLFEGIIFEDNTITQVLQTFEHEDSDLIKIINRNLTLDSNFAVALGNYFLEDLKTKADNQEDQNDQGMNQNVNESFLKKYFEHFKRLIKRNSHPSKVCEVYITQFLKYYCLRYLDAIQQDQDQSVTWRVDELLNEKSQTADTLRLYLLKNILYRKQKMTLVRSQYLENKRCKWLQHFRTLVCGKTFEILAPPPFQEEQNKLTGLITKFRNQQYENVKTFAQIIEQSFASPITKYEFLTFMMNDIYTRSCSEDKIIQMSQMVKNNDRYKDPANSVELNLLNCYFNHKISQVFKYDERQMETQQAKIQEFVRNQLVFINYLNIFVACSKSECPLIEMFFDMNGNVPEDYVDWIERRFLVNGRENQSVSILKRFIELGDNTPGYYKCSTECDMFYTIGGSGGFGCQLPRVQSICGWCKKTIGGTNHNLTRANEGARKVDLTQLPQQLEIIRQKKKLQVLNHKLSGYSYNLNLEEMKKEVTSNRRLPQSAKYILQQMIFSVWSFLASTNQISQDSVKQIFHMNSRVFEVESAEVVKQFYTMQTKALNLNEEDQSDLVWHLGMSKQIMKFIIEYKTKLTHQLKQRMGLIRCAGRDMFEEYLVNNVVLKHSSGNEKLALVNRSRCVRAGVNLSGQQILRQTGNYEQYQDQYPKIRLIKVLYENKQPNFDNMVEEYREKINRDYKILSYYIEHQEQVQKLRKYRTLYTFISKILKLFNLKITRQQAKTKSLLKLYQQIYRSNAQGTTSELNSFRQELTKFCQVWNELRESKFQLRYGCHMFGFMNQVSIQLQLTSEAVNFFPDIKYKGHQKGEMILSLLQVTSQEYNEICRQINHAKMGSQKYRQIEIFNSKPLNPTQIHDFTKTLDLSRELIQDSFISNYSNWSVEYGCGLPHYSIDKIESLMVEHIVGCHNLNEEIKEYDTINYIGQQLNFIVQIRNLQNQLQWDSIPRKQEIEKFIYTLKHDEPDSFLKQINSIKGSIELVLHYFRLKKGIDIKGKTIEEFIRENKIQIMSKTLLSQPLLMNIEMQYILAFYEFIQLHTLKNAVQCLDDSYKKEKLSDMQIRNLNMFMTELKNEYKPEEEINYHLSIALYRFVVRSLLLVEKEESLDLFSFIYGAYDLWPHNFDHQRLATVRYFREAFWITLTKMQSLLEQIPFEVKKSKTEIILIDKKQTHHEMIKKAKEPEKIKTGGGKGKKRNI